MPLLQVRPRPKTEISQNKDQPLDLIIIGGGPAGLTAAIYALRARLKILLVEKMILGGQATTTFLIENYPGFPEGVSGMALGERLQLQANNLGLNTCFGNVVSLKEKKPLWEVQVDGKTLMTKAIIIATGTESAKMGIPGEKELRGRGVSYCATCDGAFYQDKNVMVVGGGNSAIEEALFLTRYAAKVSIVHRRDQLRADKILADRAQANPKIYFFWHSVLEQINGEQKVNSVTIKDLSNRNRLTIPIDGVFVYIGSRPNSDLVKGIVKLDRQGYITTDQEMRSSAKGIWAIGDVRAKQLRQIVTAAADGAIAAESARKYIEAH
jgi:thioredoxin reductase (NADPH)